MTAAARQAAETLRWLERRGTRKNREGMARYGLPADRTYGVSVGDLQRHAKSLGRDHALATALWDTGWYEARMLAAFVDEPGRVTSAQMDRWARDFDNWGICDTVIMHLFDQTPHAWRKVPVWCGRQGEFVRRAGFAMLASLALHDTTSEDHRFLAALPLIRAASGDDRNFVKKGVNWALRSIGNRSLPLHAAAIALAERLAGEEDATARWIGKDALRDLRRPLVRKRVAAKDRKRIQGRARGAEPPVSGAIMTAKKPAAKKSTATKPEPTSAKGGPGGSVEVDAWMKQLTDPRAPLLTSIRRLIRKADPRIVEGIKWNSPSFHWVDWFATTNLRGKEGVMLVLHTGAKVKASATHGVPVKDPDGLLRWLAKDRAVVTFADSADLKARGAALTRIIQQWVELM